MDNPLHRLRPKKEFGQHFLMAPHAIRGIVEEALAAPSPRLLEIGPGPGILTAPLLEDGRPLWAVELDPEACALLNQRFGTQAGFHLLQGDAVRVDLPPGGPWSIAGNLPYNAATAILTRFLLEPIPWDRMVLMFQLEVGQKLMGKPGEKSYGPLSVLAQLCTRMTRLLKLGPGAFSPPPKVDSVVIRFDPGPDPLPHEDRRPFLAFLHRVFAHRRKTLVNNLIGNLPAEEGRELLQAQGIAPSVRAEALAPRALLSLFRAAQGLHWNDGSR
jgi:16S rRNA (adenine1518-N6/adenine1519-N6)-dimethyltransferase